MSTVLVLYPDGSTVQRLNQIAIMDTIQWAIRDKRNQLKNMLYKYPEEWRKQNPIEWLKILRDYYEQKKKTVGIWQMKQGAAAMMKIPYEDVPKSAIEVQKKKYELQYEMKYEREKQRFTADTKRGRKVRRNRRLLS
jgi:hypothetical protein